MIPAQQLASRTAVFGQTLTRPSRSDLGQLCTICPMPSLEKQLKWMLHAGHNGHNQNASELDLPCLLGRFTDFYPYHWLHKHSNSQYHWLQKTFKLPADYSHKVAQQGTQSLHSCLLCIWVHHHVLIIDCTATSDWLKMSKKKKICTKLCEYKWNWQCELTLPEDPHCHSAGSGWWRAACGLKRTVHCAATPCNTGKLLLSHQVVVLDAPFARQIDLRILLCQSQYAF